MHEQTLTLDFLARIYNKSRKALPKREPMVGIIVNDSAWASIKKELEEETTFSSVGTTYLSSNDKLWGAPVYGCPDISPTYAEIYFDKEVLSARLKELKIK